jgi:hypothetical protein
MPFCDSEISGEVVEADDSDGGEEDLDVSRLLTSDSTGPFDGRLLRKSALSCLFFSEAVKSLNASREPPIFFVSEMFPLVRNNGFEVLGFG